MKNLDRKLEISAKFLQMGQALMKEGNENKDNAISLIGSMLIFIGGITLEDDDVYKFSELVSMFSAKKVMDMMEQDGKNYFADLKNLSDSETYDGMVDKLENLRKLNKKNKGNDKKD